MFCLSEDFQQLSFDKQISQIETLLTKSPTKFLRLLKNHLDLPSFIPKSFYNAYYSSGTNSRDISLESILSILLLIHFFNFASVPNFLFALCFSPELCDFCHIKNESVPTESVISKFKTRFDFHLKELFDNIVLHVIDIFNQYDESLSDNAPHKGLNQTLIYDTTALKPKVKENNPKFVASEIKKQSNYKSYLNKNGQDTSKFNPYSAAYKNLPKSALANSSIRLDYANGHFGYFYKFGMLTNGFGIPLHIHFLDESFYKELPNDFNSMEEQKFVFDNASLKPVFSSFSQKVNRNTFSTFVADSEFDSYANYSFLNQVGFSKVVIPLNSRNSPSNERLLIKANKDKIPCCPKDPSLIFKSDGSCNGKNRSFRLKYVCPKSKRLGKAWTCECEDKCRPTNSTVTTYVYPNGDLRTFSGVIRGSDEWNTIYKNRAIIERKFSSLKSNPLLAQPKTHNCSSMRSDVFLNATTKLLTVILAFALNKPNYMSNLRKLIKAVA